MYGCCCSVGCSGSFGPPVVGGIWEARGPCRFFGTTTLSGVGGPGVYGCCCCAVGCSSGFGPPVVGGILGAYGPRGPYGFLGTAIIIHPEATLSGGCAFCMGAGSVGMAGATIGVSTGGTYTGGTYAICSSSCCGSSSFSGTHNGKAQMSKWQAHNKRKELRSTYLRLGGRTACKRR